MALPMHPTWDLFISHASEDKETFVRPLVELLHKLEVRVWYDEFALELGDSLSASIDKGLSNSRYGLVVISKSFISKGWPQYELRGLTSLEVGRAKRILPIWHGVTREEVLAFSPPLADKVADDTSKQPLDQLAYRILRVVHPEKAEALHRYQAYRREVEAAPVQLTSLDEVKPGPVRHQRLPPSMLLRLRLIYGILGEHFGVPFEQWIDTFRRDLHPEDEVLIWEAIALIYLEETRARSSDAQERGEIYFLLLALSLTGVSQVRLDPKQQPSDARAIRDREITLRYKHLKDSLEQAMDSLIAQSPTS